MRLLPSLALRRRLFLAISGVDLVAHTQSSVSLLELLVGFLLERHEVPLPFHLAIGLRKLLLVVLC